MLKVQSGSSKENRHHHREHGEPGNQGGVELGTRDGRWGGGGAEPWRRVPAAGTQPREQRALRAGAGTQALGTGQKALLHQQGLGGGLVPRSRGSTRQG